MVTGDVALIPKDVLLAAIHELPGDKLSLDSIATKVAWLFKIETGIAQSKAKQSAPLEAGQDFFEKYATGNAWRTGKRRPVDAETYRQNLLKVSVGAEEDLAVFDEIRESFNKTKVEQW